MKMTYIFTPSFLISVLFISCNEKKEVTKIRSIPSTEVTRVIPDTTINKSTLQYNNKTSTWSFNDEPYSGYAVSFYNDGTLKEKIGISFGKKEKQALRWYSDGSIKIIENYHNGKLHGEKKIWSSDSILLSHLNYQSGKPHGEQMTWYPSGELHKKLNMNKGREEGIQQAFRENGALYANYEAKAGRIYGLRKTALCYGLESERIQYTN